ncbi:cyclase family protein [Nocardia fusca]|uniref:Cyclase family protein n=1 Tax=Nocardia fusca TaxID=941183 RepID=A0ABV3FJF7_9NOCA
MKGLRYSGHVGTYLDAVSHVAVDNQLHGGVPVAEAMHAGRYRSHGIDHVRSLVCRGVLYDVLRSRKVTRLDPGTAVGVADLAAGPEPKPGDVALIRMGWAQLWHESRSYVGDGSGVYGVDLGAAEWLAGHGVAAVGADTVAREHRPPGPGPAPPPIHRLLLHEHGINLIEVRALATLSETLASAGTAEFLFVGAPLNVVGATGAPIRPLAVVSA